MNAELLYTSAPAGLKQGSRGFCTVVSTAGMPINLASKLESLSGYRHVYPSGTPDAKKNPVGSSHLRFSLGGRMVSVISRISDYGLDYSQRTNKLAHHIVVDAPMPPSGPAALLLQSGVMRDAWDGRCATVPPPALPTLEIPPRVCSEWESMTSDAGWGGVVANTWLRPQPKPLFIVFSEDQAPRLLSLIAESIALLPVRQRWQATFGTYVTNLPPDVDCKVRCVIAGSEEARMASARGTVIDLTKTMGPAVDSDETRVARAGLFIGGATTRASAAVPDAETPELDASAYAIPPDHEVFEFDTRKSSGDEASQAPPSVRSPGTRFKAKVKVRKRTKAGLPIREIVAVSCCALLLMLGFVGFANYQSSQQTAKVVEANKRAVGREKNNDAAKPRADRQRTDIVTPDDMRAESAVANNPAADTAKVTEAAEMSAESKAAEDKAAADKAAADKAAAEELAAKSLQLKAEDIDVVVDGFSLVGMRTLSKSAQQDDAKYEVSIPVGVYGSEAKASLRIKNKDQKSAIEKAKTTWIWETKANNADNTGDHWEPIAPSGGEVLTVTTDIKPNSEIRARGEVLLGNGQSISLPPSRPMRIADVVLIEIIINPNFLSGGKGNPIDNIEIALNINQETINAFSTGNYRLKPFGLNIASRKTMKDLRRNTDDANLVLLVTKVEELRSKRSAILSMLSDLKRVSYSKRENAFCQNLALAIRVDELESYVRFAEVRTDLAQWQANTEQTISKYEAHLGSDRKLGREEKEDLLKELPETVRPHVDQIPAYRIIWETELPSIKSSPKGLVEKLVSEIAAYEQSLSELAKSEWIVDTKKDAFIVSANEASAEENSGLSTQAKRVASFSSRVVLRFVEGSASTSPTAGGTASAVQQPSPSPKAGK